jgi:hypothetical protein
MAMTMEASTASTPGAKLLQLGILGLTRAISARIVLKMADVVTWLIDVVLRAPFGHTSEQDCPAPPSIQPCELGGMEVGQAFSPQQHMRRCPLVAPSQLEFMFERKQLSVLVVEKEGVAEFEASARNVEQPG